MIGSPSAWRVAVLVAVVVRLRGAYGVASWPSVPPGPNGTSDELERSWSLRTSDRVVSNDWVSVREEEFDRCAEYNDMNAHWHERTTSCTYNDMHARRHAHTKA